MPRDRVRHLTKQPRQRRSPKTQLEWQRLMQKVIARARQLKDRRLPGLERVMAPEQRQRIPKVLQQMGIICENDILREFPDPKPSTS